MEYLVHGVYDAQTLKSLISLDIPQIGFDLRGRSLNLIPFHTLKSLLPSLKNQKFFLIFENDKSSTVLSFLDLLGDKKNKFELEFRDQQSGSYYASFNHPFSWFFHPEGDWETILKLPNLKSIILPVKYQQYYQNLSRLWFMIQERNLKVVLHVESFSDLELYVHEKNLSLSIDLGKEMELGFRRIDQNRLLNLNVWRKNYASVAGQ